MPSRLNTDGANLTTPYGMALVNSSGRVLWAEWEVWRHAADLVAAGLWSSSECHAAGRQRLIYSLVGPAPAPAENVRRWRG